MNDVFFLIASFCLFVIAQSIFINGVHASFRYECTEDIKKGRVCMGLIFKDIAIWMDDHVKYDWIKKPLYKCVRCMSSFWGGLTYWPAVLMLFGWGWEEIPVFIFDVFILSILTFYVYKKIA